MSEIEGQPRKHVYLPNHPLAPKTGTMLVSRVNLYAKIGAGPHQCHWCGRWLKWRVLAIRGRPKSNVIVTDHLDGDHTNDDPTNLVPSCNGCNISRGTRDLEPGDPDAFVTVAGIRNRADKKVCIVCGIEFLIPISQTKYRLGRFCSRACRNKGVAAENGIGIQPGELFIEITEKSGRIKRVRAVKLECETCHKEFTSEARKKARFCSSSCAAIGREKAKRS